MYTYVKYLCVCNYKKICILCTLIKISQELGLRYRPCLAARHLSNPAESTERRVARSVLNMKNVRVAGIPTLWIYMSQLGLLFPIHGIIKDVPNHQPADDVSIGKLNVFQIFVVSKMVATFEDEIHMKADQIHIHLTIMHHHPPSSTSFIFFWMRSSWKTTDVHLTILAVIRTSSEKPFETTTRTELSP